MSLKVFSVFFWLICVSTFAFAQNSDAIDCPKGSYGIAINNPNAGKAKTVDSPGVKAEQTKKADYLNCKISEFSPLVTSTFVLGTASIKMAFVTTTVAALKKSSSTQVDYDLRAKAIYLYALGNAGQKIDINRAYRNTQCQRGYNATKPLDVPSYIPARVYDLALAAPNIDEISSAWKVLDRFSTAELKFSCNEAIRKFIQSASR